MVRKLLATSDKLQSYAKRGTTGPKGDMMDNPAIWDIIHLTVQTAESSLILILQLLETAAECQSAGGNKDDAGSLQDLFGISIASLHNFRAFYDLTSFAFTEL